MKKKLSILPIVVLALTMLFGTVCVWADPIPVNEVKITMPPFCEGKTAGGFLSEINVSVKIPDGAYTSEHLVPLEYHGTTNYNNFTRKSPLPEYDPRSTDKMINGKYLISLNVISASVNYYSFDPNVVSITLNGSPIIPYSLTQTTTDVITVKFYYTFGATPQAASTEKEAVAIIDRDLFKSEAPSKTVIVADSIGAKSFFDMKVHAADAQTQANQKLLAQNLVGGANTKIFLFQRMVL